MNSTWRSFKTFLSQNYIGWFDLNNSVFLVKNLNVEISKEEKPKNFQDLVQLGKKKICLSFTPTKLYQLNF